MSASDPATGLRATIRADLAANTGRTRLRDVPAGFLFHPGFATLLLHRIAAGLVRTRWRKLGDLMWAWNTRRSGCHLHPRCAIGPGLALPHPTAVVIGEGALIGAGVTIYQLVTVGRAARGGYPVIGDGATLYPGAVVFGAISVGAGARVGAGAILSIDVPAGATAAGPPARVLQPRAFD